MELRHLRYFVAIAETLHFGQAAVRLGITQPSLTHQIQQLESELQSRLLNRTKRRVALTDAGRSFLEEAREILARADRAAMMARRISGREAGRLRVGAGSYMDQMAISRAVSIFSSRHEQVRVEVQTMPVPLQLAALRDEGLDVGFVRPPFADTSLNGEIVCRERLLAALPRNHRLAGKRAVSLRSLADDPFILPARDRVPVFHDLVLRVCRDAGFVPDAPHEADHLQLMLGMVAARTGVAVLPESAGRIKPNRVVFASIRPEPVRIETAVAWKGRATSPMVTAFLSVAREVLRERPRRH